MKEWRTPSLQILDLLEVARTISANAQSEGGGGGSGCGCDWCVSYFCTTTYLL